MRVFGQKPEGVRATARPGAHGLIMNETGQLAVVRTPGGVFLPGGGINPGETAEAALVREVREECGLDVRVGGRLVEATQFVSDPVEGHFAKQCVFYRCAIDSAGGAVIEQDHETLWLSIADARQLLRHESQSWAVSLLDESC